MKVLESTNYSEVFGGCNVENASYGLTICAERVAICNAVSHEHGNHIDAIAVYNIEDFPPCGACRQFIYEFGKDIEVVFMHEKKLICVPISELLAYSFSL